MQVINENSALLSNHEVFSLLSDIQCGTNGQRKPANDQNQLATVTYETLKYLERTPAAHQSPEVIANFVSRLEPFNLTKAEQLQLLNHRPTTAVEIQLIVEENEERLTVEQLSELIQLVTTVLPSGETAQQTVDAEEKS